jgi:tyrosyl-tRNA synthetase
VRKLIEEFRGSDAVMWEYFTLLTDLPPADIEDRRSRFERGELSASELRLELATSIASGFHGRKAVERAAAAVRTRHAVRVSLQHDTRMDAQHEAIRQALDAGAPTVQLAAGREAVNLSRIVADLGFAPSSSEATRQIKAGGVRVNGERVTDFRWTPPGEGMYVLLVGSKKLAVIRVDAAEEAGSREPD